jgi:acyl-CoA synthetase (AMP-forming)/AMP-acid ligase II
MPRPSTISRALAPLADAEVRAMLARGRREALSMGRGLWENFFWQKEETSTIPVLLSNWAQQAPHDRLMWFEGRWITVAAFDAQVNRLARALRGLGISRGDVVALVFDNSPAYLQVIYAVMRLGGIAALVNPNLTGRSLAHAVRVAKPSLVVATDERWHAVKDALAAGEQPGDDELRVIVATPHDPLISEWQGVPQLLAQASGELPTPPADLPPLTLDDVAAFIYTSGTTGLPKPAVVKHHRLWRAGWVFGGFLRVTADDCIFTALPLYHANATMIAASIVITHRARIALTARFSVSRFWRDCEESGATAFIYVGELGRYLANAPPSDADRRHSVRRIIGNGLRQDLWPTMRERFGIEKILEFYAATEGNAETANLFDVDGAVGPYMPWKMALVKCDAHTGELLRGPDGLCQSADFDEPGLLLGKIAGKNEYVGYLDKNASNSKIVRNVRAPGDTWFDSGDLLRYDRRYHLHFVDRLGDTFRWKGENVSTLEVTHALISARGIRDVSVYGVVVPGAEGRAGMAAIVRDETFSLEDFARHVERELPGYARPRFLRFVEEIEVTGTFKQRLVEMQRQGWGADDASRASLDGDIHVLESGRYERLDDARRVAILEDRFAL